MKDNKENNSRRKFLDKGLKIGLTAAIGGGVASVLANSNKDVSDDEMVELLSTEGELVQVAGADVVQIPTKDDYDVREGFPNRKFVMVVDLAKCKNAKKCQISCNKMHYVTGPNAWLKIYKMQDSEESAPYWQPTMCMHCDKPPCVKVCPVDATFKRRDGIVLIDNERCIGCRFCMAACPYSARVFNWSDPESVAEAAKSEYSPETSVPSQVGTVNKCDFCPDSIDKGELPHCVGACPNGVFAFGDAYEDSVTNGEETFRLSELLKERAGYRMMEELGTSPNVYYLPPTDRLVDFEDGMKNYDEHSSVSNPK